MKVSAIIAAGGRGARVAADRPKQLLAVGGRALLEWTVTLFSTHPSINEVVVALPPELVDSPPSYLAGAASASVRVVVGGARRQDSVANAFAAVASDADVIVIHDAARPFASADLVSRTIRAAAESGAALAAIPARDTVKVVDRSFVARTLPRETIYLAQTPQAFRRDVLAAAVAVGGDATDEAALAERAGHAVRIVDGEITNIKVTTPEDLAIAEAIATQQSASKPPRTGRAGTGYDLHRLVDGRPLVVGGITLPSNRGPLGHSDGDVACHAITDAILGAAGRGDIGTHFPDTDPAWKDASSLELLSRVVSFVHREGYEVGNVDVTIVLQEPKIRAHVDAMRAAIAGAIGIDPSRVSVKGKTNEGLDAIGRGEAIAAHAVALIRARGSGSGG
jgi:2-C-methyl-D-erythritol 4-phosphate cytidylyltransferase / 2-C-methyl-D-erythritol 2,4-cyclodiphosphate synthase